MSDIAKASRVLDEMKRKINDQRRGDIKGCVGNYGDASYGDYGDHRGGGDQNDAYGDASYGDYGDHSSR